MEEAVSGVKGQLAIKIYGDDLKTLEAKGDEIVGVMHTMPGIADLGSVPRHRPAQPRTSRSIATQAARYGLNVADVQDAIETAVGGKAVTQVLQGEQRYDLVVRYQSQYRNTKRSHREHPLAVAHPASVFRWRNSATCMCATARPKFTAKATRAMSP